MRPLAFIILILLGGGTLLGSAVYQEKLKQDRIAARKAEYERQTRIETADVIGFPDVVSADEGELVTITGYLDIKFLCYDVGGQKESCTASILNADSRMLIKLDVCSDDAGTNCIKYPSVRRDMSDVYVRDHKGNAIDLDGRLLVEEPDTSSSDPKPFRMTGKVTKAYGTGRMIEPIMLIERED